MLKTKHLKLGWFFFEKVSGRQVEHHDDHIKENDGDNNFPISTQVGFTGSLPNRQGRFSNS